MISIQFELRYNTIIKETAKKCRLQNIGHIISVSMCQLIDPVGS